MNYLFSALLVTPTDDIFNSVNSLVTQDKKPKMYINTAKAKIIRRVRSSPLGSKQKTTTTHRQNQCKDTSMSDLLFLPVSMKKMKYFKSLTINAALTSWWKAIKITKSSLTPCKPTSVWNNPNFQLCKKPIYFPKWQHGITHVHH